LRIFGGFPPFFDPIPESYGILPNCAASAAAAGKTWQKPEKTRCRGGGRWIGGGGSGRPVRGQRIAAGDRRRIRRG